MGYFDRASGFCSLFDLIFLVLDLQMLHGQAIVSHFVLEISL